MTTTTTTTAIEKEEDATVPPHRILHKPVSTVLVVSFVVALLTLASYSSNQGMISQYYHYHYEYASTTTTTTAEATVARDTLDPRTIFHQLLRDKYPECRVLSHHNTKTIDLDTMGRYVQVISNNATNPPYDHISCFLMKARYNCAYRPNAPFRMAHHYELVLQLSLPSSNDTSTTTTTAATTATVRDKECRIKALIGDTLQEWSEQWSHSFKNVTSTTTTTTNPPKNIYRIRLQGNSYLRQLWEALACGILASSKYSRLVTHLSLQQGGPGISLQDFATRSAGGGGGDGGGGVDVNDLGRPLTNRTYLQQRGCHGENKADLSAYYRRKAVVPPNLPGCNDNVAVLELAHQWRISYMFKPTMYTPNALEYLFRERLGIPSSSSEHTTTNPTISSESEQDVLVWNSVMKEPQNITPPRMILPKRQQPQQWNIESWLWKLRDLQLRDLNSRYFGANNPWVHPGDFHACMPGPPDDQAHLLLYLLWSGYSMTTP